jgi:hypothetical protein
MLFEQWDRDVKVNVEIHDRAMSTAEARIAGPVDSAR